MLCAIRLSGYRAIRIHATTSSYARKNLVDILKAFLNNSINA